MAVFDRERWHSWGQTVTGCDWSHQSHHQHSAASGLGREGAAQLWECFKTPALPFGFWGCCSHCLQEQAF